jgi:hypothetical protein
LLQLVVGGRNNGCGHELAHRVVKGGAFNVRHFLDTDELGGPFSNAIGLAEVYALSCTADRAGFLAGSGKLCSPLQWTSRYHATVLARALTPVSARHAQAKAAGPQR